MPRVSIWLVRASLIHFLSGATLGTLYLWLKVTGWPVFALTHRPVHVEQMLIGWLVQLVIGVAYWILPRRPGQASGSSEPLMWVVFGLLNGGVLLAALGGDPALPTWIATPGRTFEAVAVLIFAAHAWTRQRAYSPAATKLII